MNRHYRLAAVLSLLVLAVACNDKDAPPAKAGEGAGDDIPLVDTVFSAWDMPGSPGCALAVAQNGILIYSRGYGYANLDHDIPIRPQTVFDVGSVTKQFVAASITMLAEDGKLSLDDDVREWLPELPEHERPIALRHMVHHTSGLRDYLNLFPLAGRDHYFPISAPQILAMMARQRALIFSPGEQYLYSNTAYMLLAQVVERASGQTLSEFVQARIFEPLQMQGSFMYDNYEKIIRRRATGYDRGEDGLVRMVHNYNFDVVGDGQMYSTVEDLLRWDDFLHGAHKPSIYADMLTEGTLNNGDPAGYARGIVLGEYRGLRTVGHTGSSWGSQSVLIRFVEPGLAIAISCNDGNSSPRRLAEKVADYFLADPLEPRIELAALEEVGQAVEAAAEPVVLAADQLAGFAGSFYSEELDASYRFAVEGGGLVLRIEQEPALELRAVSEDRFEIGFPDQAYWDQPMARVGFLRDETGAVTGFSLNSGTERNIGFERHR